MQITIEASEDEILELYVTLRAMKFCKNLSPDDVLIHRLLVRFAEAAQAQAIVNQEAGGAR